MADVFISYARQDADAATKLAAELVSHGYSVWWDSNLIGADDFRKVIESELMAAAVCLVIWSRNSIESKFVKDEADVALRYNKLIATHVNEFDLNLIPMGFIGQHCNYVFDTSKILDAINKIGSQTILEQENSSKFYRMALIAKLAKTLSGVALYFTIAHVVMLSIFYRITKSITVYVLNFPPFNVAIFGVMAGVLFAIRGEFKESDFEEEPTGEMKKLIEKTLIPSAIFCVAVSLFQISEIIIWLIFGVFVGLGSAVFLAFLLTWAIYAVLFYYYVYRGPPEKFTISIEN